MEIKYAFVFSVVVLLILHLIFGGMFRRRNRQAMRASGWQYEHIEKASDKWRELQSWTAVAMAGTALWIIAVAL